MGHLEHGVLTEHLAVADVGGHPDGLVGVLRMPADPVVVGGERQGADAEHHTARFDRQLPLSRTELVERCRDRDQLSDTDVDVGGLGFAVRVELREVGDRSEGRAVVVEAEDLVVGVAGQGAPVGAVLAQPYSVSETASVQYYEVRVAAVSAVVGVYL